MKAWNYKITKPNSRIDPSIIKSIFKGFLHRAHEICLDKYIKEEIVFNMSFCREWTSERTFLENLVKNYNARKKNNDSRNYLGYLTLHQKLGNSLKR